MGRLLCAVVALTPLLACGPEDTTQILDARIVTSDGVNPLTTGEFDRLRIVWAQTGFDTVAQEIDLTGETFEVPFELEPVAGARIRVELTGPSGSLVGAPPRFPPLATLGFLRIVVGQPGTCAVVRRFDGRDPARAESGYVRWEGFLLQLGGLADSGPTDAVTFSDLYWASAETGEPLVGLTERAGRTRAALLGQADGVSDHFALVLSDEGVWRYQLDGASADGERALPLTLYEGAGADSAVARTGVGVVLVAGGGEEASPSRELARIATDGTVRLGGLLGGRRAAGAGPAAEDAVVVAGGARAPGAPFAEWVDLATLVPTAIEAPSEGVRRDPLVLEGTDSHWIVGGTDADGAPLTSSWVLRGCPAACRLEAGPEVDLGTAPRAEGLTVTDGRAVFTAVDEGGWRLERVADLVAERRAAGITRYESGIVFVHGGRDDEGPRLDGELCFPAALVPLD